MDERRTGRLREAQEATMFNQIEIDKAHSEAVRQEEILAGVQARLAHWAAEPERYLTSAPFPHAAPLWHVRPGWVFAYPWFPRQMTEQGAVEGDVFTVVGWPQHDENWHTESILVEDAAGRRMTLTVPYRRLVNAAPLEHQPHETFHLLPEVYALAFPHLVKP